MTDDPPQPPRAGAAPLHVAIRDDTGSLNPAALLWLSDHTRRAAEEHLALAGDIRLLLVDDHAMTDAHERHLGRRSTTDVITFDLAEGRTRESGRLDIDLLLCVGEARRQADARAIPVERELLLYAIHGLLHALGHDDHDEAAARAMHAREDELLTALGVGVTYDLSGDGAPRGADAS